MWTQAGTLLLLLACCLSATEAQSENGPARPNGNAETRKSVWEDPIQFNSKGGDLCTMIVTGQGELTRLRISCQGDERSYWCEYSGKPQLCRAYNNNPRHYFTQIMWDLRKLQNACQAPKTIKPQMCKRAPEESQMVFTASSTQEAAPQRPEKQPPQAKPDAPKAPTTKQLAARPPATRPPGAAKPVASKPNVKTTALRKMLTPKPTPPKPTKPAVKSNAKRIAQDYCWRSLQGVCSYVIGWFQN
ncbi:fibroblast growth factor binding protein 2a [Aplochiton taeniatus]